MMTVGRSGPCGRDVHYAADRCLLRWLVSGRRSSGWARRRRSRSRGSGERSSSHLRVAWEDGDSRVSGTFLASAEPPRLRPLIFDRCDPAGDLRGSGKSWIGTSGRLGRGRLA
jgi:hypothetical protein